MDDRTSSVCMSDHFSNMSGTSRSIIHRAMPFFLGVLRRSLVSGAVASPATDLAGIGVLNCLVDVGRCRWDMLGARQHNTMASNLRAMASNPNSDGLHPSSDGLHPTSDGLHPTSDGLQPKGALASNLMIAMSSSQTWQIQHHSTYCS